MSSKKLGLLITGAIVGTASLIGGILWYAIATNTFDSPGLTESLARAEADPRVTERLGHPLTIEPGGTGAQSRQHDHQLIDVRVPLVGPRGRGTLDVVGFSYGGEPWEFAVMAVTTGEERLDLLPPTTR
ncbi:MAG: hypothetical protein KC731_08410 [Myxococcales bacterium]|nr:hypothetical protein [Myxococcales bacterium]